MIRTWKPCTDFLKYRLAAKMQPISPKSRRRHIPHPTFLIARPDVCRSLLVSQGRLLKQNLGKRDHSNKAYLTERWIMRLLASFELIYEFFVEAFNFDNWSKKLRYHDKFIFCAVGFFLVISVFFRGVLEVIDIRCDNDLDIMQLKHINLLLHNCCTTSGLKFYRA